MLSILLVVNTCVAVALVVLILLQKTDPAAGGMFGGAGGTTQTVVRNPLARPTAWLAAAFMILSLAMAVLAKGGGKGHVEGSVMAEANLPAPAALQPAMVPTALLTSPTLEVSPALLVPAASPTIISATQQG
jgi:preprotein translocase subunit SecG